ncbi:MAG: amino acid adenylation domain-containing protein, partial [Bacteroidota bacterium]
MWQKYPFGKEEVSCMKTSLGFVDHLWEIFGPLLKGIKTVIFSKEEVIDVENLIAQLAAQQVTRIVLVPSLLKAMLSYKDACQQKLNHLKYWTCSGEVLSTELVTSFYQTFQQSQLLNIYGSTEVTADATCFNCNELLIADRDPNGKALISEALIPIGKPISNTQILILDENKAMVPIGVQGQIYVSGAGVSMGYLRQEESTNPKFVTNILPGQEAQLWYQTGDFAKWLPDGNISYLGRKDHQVKIRGYRIGLNEVEAALESLPEIDQSILQVKTDTKNHLQLVAYFSLEAAQKDIDPKAIKQKLREVLPDYMVPNLLVQLETFPLNASGKIDRNALPEPDFSAVDEVPYVAPRNKTEVILCSIWRELIDQDQIGVQDNFFEIGGHSLIAMRVASAVREALNQEIKVVDIFNYPTIAELAEHLSVQAAGIFKFAPLQKVDLPERIPLSYSQERLWFIDQIEGSVQYHLPAVMRLGSDLNVGALEKALHRLVEHHQALRTVFRSTNGQPYQEVRASDEWQMELVQSDDFEAPHGVNEYVTEAIEKPFDLSNDYMIRAKLLAVANGDFVLVLVMHHIAIDGWSKSILVNDLVELYRAELNGSAAQLDNHSFQYTDYANWQRQNLSGAYLQAELQWWAHYLSGTEPIVLPTDFPRPSVKSIQGETEGFTIDKAVTEQLKALSYQSGSSLFMTMLAVFKVLLYRYSGQEDISVGTSLANRDYKGLESIVGFFINQIVLRNNLGGNPSFKDFLAQLKLSTLEAYQHQQVPFAKVVEHVETERDRSRNPLFQVLFVFQNTPDATDLKFGDVELRRASSGVDTSHFDLQVSISEIDGELRLRVIYANELFRTATIQQLMTHYQNLLREVVENPEAKITELSILSQKEQAHLLLELNDMHQEFSLEKSIVDLFDEQVERSPDHVALVFEGEEWTYQFLQEKVNQLATYLREDTQVGPNDLVGILLERSPWAVIAILGILKAGAAYVPIDIDYPEKRKAFIVEDTDLKTLIIHSNDLIDAVNLGASVFAIDLQLEKVTAQKITPFPNAQKDNLAYVIYTSGSTGQPKGVMIRESNLLNYFHASVKNYGAGMGSFSFPLFTSLSFDLTQTSIFLTLLTGGTLLVERGNDLDQILKNISENDQVNAIKLTPSHSLLLTETENRSIKKAIVGGEALTSKHVEMLQQINPDIDIYNEYGPTETTIGSTVAKIEDKDQITIGQPIANTQVYIVDQENNLVPKGAVGELCIAGAGVAKGYLNQEALTNQKFILNPFTDHDSIIYKTGDRAKWLGNGQLQYLGRVDDQVKVRGHRIELNEIAKTMATHPLVDEALVTTRQRSDTTNEIIAYFIPSDKGKDFLREKSNNQLSMGHAEIEETPTQDSHPPQNGLSEQMLMEIRKELCQKIVKYLQRELPAYMVPAWMFDLDQFPLTRNGKVDQSKLPQPDVLTIVNRKYVAPETDKEISLAAIWKDLLKVEKLGIYDNFFELGGHSLLAIQVVSRVRDQFDVNIPIMALFDYPCISDLLNYMEIRTPEEE